MLEGPVNSDRSAPVALFGDEVGLPIMLDVLGEVCPAMVVVDPKRPAACEWLAAHGNKLNVLMHPDKDGLREFESKLKASKPILGVIGSYSRILRPELISQFALGVVNVHGGRLPEYRGANVLQWAIINGESETAVTLHYVDEGIDTGPVIAQHSVAIEENDTALTLRDKMLVEMKRLLSEWLPRLLVGRVSASVQDELKARKWPRRSPSDGNIDWAWSDEQIRNLIRALVRPWPGAFYTEMSGKKRIVDHELTLEQVQRLRREVLGN